MEVIARIQFLAVAELEVPLILLTVGRGPLSAPRSCSWSLDTWIPLQYGTLLLQGHQENPWLQISDPF